MKDAEKARPIDPSENRPADRTSDGELRQLLAALPTRVDWNGNERPASAMEVTRAESTAIRIRREVEEIRAAAGQLTATGGEFEREVAEFLTVQALMLSRAGSTAQRADMMRREEDTLDDPGTFPNPARSALLIARAYLGKE